jgi:hypothetical protein
VKVKNERLCDQEHDAKMAPRAGPEIGELGGCTPKSFGNMYLRIRAEQIHKSVCEALDDFDLGLNLQG